MWHSASLSRTSFTFFFGSTAKRIAEPSVIEMTTVDLMPTLAHLVNLGILSG
jgi:hypothetical protein